jgi:di/tricarboxylate transporter
VVFSGFTSMAFWLVIGGMVLGVAVVETRLSERIGAWIAPGIRGSYLWVLSLCAIAAVIFSFFMPSSLGRLVVMIPIVHALSESVGFHVGSSGHTGMMLVLSTVSTLTGFTILPANVPNLILSGASESLYGVGINYGAYLAYHFPVLGIIKAAVIVLLTYLMFPATPGSDIISAPTGRMTHRQRMLIAILLGALALWLTDVIHHISPAWVAMGAAVICLLPRWGVVSSDAFNSKVKVEPLLFVAGVLAVGAIVADSGLGLWLGKLVISHFPFTHGASFGNYLLFVLLSAGIGLITTVPGVPAVMTPLVPPVAEATGLPLASIIHMEVAGFSTPLFPYQVPSILIGAVLAGVSVRDAGKLLAATALVTLVVIIPLNWFWLRLVGLI